MTVHLSGRFFWSRDEFRDGQEKSEKNVASYTIAVIGGDGIGPEVVAEAMKVVAAAGVEVKTVDYDLGAAHYLKTGEVLPDTLLSELRGVDAVMLGAIGPPIGSTDVPSGLLERGLLLKMRFELDLYVNERPFNGVPGAIAPDADFVVIRENTEGPYTGEGGQIRRGTPHEVATQGSVNTRFGVERCIRYAFELAERRERHHLTLVHKTNVLTFSGDLWQRAFDEVAAEHPGIATAYQHVDAACIYFATDAARYDVVVTDNLFGDILTDLGGAISGGIGLAASANLNPARTGPSLFEPVHGAAHDIAGTDKANPLAAIRSAAMMLEYLGEHDAAQRVTKAVLELSEELAGSGKNPGTQAIGDLVSERV
jgi:3-isopropylmalate dehydrogenase